MCAEPRVPPDFSEKPEKPPFPAKDAPAGKPRDPGEGSFGYDDEDDSFIPD